MVVLLVSLINKRRSSVLLKDAAVVDSPHAAALSLLMIVFASLSSLTVMIKLSYECRTTLESIVSFDLISVCRCVASLMLVAFLRKTLKEDGPRGGGTPESSVGSTAGLTKFSETWGTSSCEIFNLRYCAHFEYKNALNWGGCRCY